MYVRMKANNSLRIESKLTRVELILLEAGVVAGIAINERVIDVVKAVRRVTAIVHAALGATKSDDALVQAVHPSRPWIKGMALVVAEGTFGRFTGHDHRSLAQERDITDTNDTGAAGRHWRGRQLLMMKRHRDLMVGHRVSVAVLVGQARDALVEKVDWDDSVITANVRDGVVRCRVVVLAARNAADLYAGMARASPSTQTSVRVLAIDGNAHLHRMVVQARCRAQCSIRQRACRRRGRSSPWFR